jgi:hypothetical protein
MHFIFQGDGQNKHIINQIYEHIYIFMYGQIFNKKDWVMLLFQILSTSIVFIYIHDKMLKILQHMYPNFNLN